MKRLMKSTVRMDKKLKTKKVINWDNFFMREEAVHMRSRCLMRLDGTRDRG